MWTAVDRDPENDVLDLELQAAKVACHYTCTYSTGLSSPVSRTATYLDAGNAFGVRCSSACPCVFRTVIFAIATKTSAQDTWLALGHIPIATWRETHICSGP